MTRWIARRLRQEDFEPRFLGLFSNPYYFARRSLYAEMARLAPLLHGRLLDIGCGRKPYATLFSVQQYIGLEIDRADNRATKAADYFYDGTRMPFGNADFDTALCNQVLEHVFDPAAFLAEIHRVLKPGGTLLLTVPFAWNEHEQPWDFARYTTFGLRHILEREGFDVLEQRRTCADARAICQLINAYTISLVRSRHRTLNALACILLIAPVNMLGEVLSRVMPANPDLYLDQVVLARRRHDGRG